MAPVIQINGDNSAIIQVTVTVAPPSPARKPTSTLGIQNCLSGIFESPLEVDTSQPAIDTIDYVATDGAGLIATTTRTLIIQAPISLPQVAETTTATSTA
jgi:hypothetical protein